MSAQPADAIGQLPAEPPAEVLRWARRHFATDAAGGVPVFTVGTDPFQACDRAAAAAWKAAVLYAAGMVLPDPPPPYELRRCLACLTELRMVPTEASGGQELMPLETAPHLDGIAVIFPTEAGPRARIYGSVTDAQVAAGTRYRPHWANCGNAAEFRQPRPANRKKGTQS